MAIKRICAAGSRYAHKCLGCGKDIQKVSRDEAKDVEVIICQHCRTVNLISFTESGNAVMTDYRYIRMLKKSDKEKDDE